jgi:phage gp36-like protein
MAFIIESDYDVQLRSEISGVIDPTQEKSKLKKAEDMAISQMKNYLAGRYDIDQIFVDAPADGDDDPRDSFIVMCAIDMALYHLWSKEGGNRIPQTRSDRYADCLEWLKAVQKGAACNLPVITDDEGNESHDIRIWSKHEPENNRF